MQLKLCKFGELKPVTFDNDGTLWVEHPKYTQLAFVLDRVKELAPAHPEWKTTQPFKAVLDGDMKALGAAGDRARLMGLVHHDDVEREYAYGPADGLPKTPFGTFSQSTMDEAKQNGWIVISMKDDWKRMFTFDE